MSEEATRRKYVRHMLEVEVNLRSADTFYTGFSENISEGGLFIATDAPFELGSRVEVTLSLMGGKPTPYTTVVCWVRPAGAAGGLPAGMGVQFEGLGDESSVELQAFIDSQTKDTLFYEV